MDAALSILAALLRVDVQTEESQADFLPDRNVGRFTNNSYDVAEATEGALPDLLAGDALSTFAKLVKQLRGAQRRMAFQDSTGWRNAVAGPDERPEFELRHLLLQLLRDAGAYIATAEPERLEEALALLEAEESEISCACVCICSSART